MTHENDSGLLRTSSGCIIIDRATFEIDGNPTVQILNCILTIPTSLTASLANLLVIISIWRTPSLHTPSNVLLVSLSLSDLGVGLVSQPIFLAFSIVKIKGLADMFCSSTHALSVSGFCLSGASLLTLTAISLDRFIAIHLHLRYSEIVTVKRVTVIVIVAWFALIPSATSIFWAGYTLVDYLSIVVIFLCLFITTLCYCMIYRVVRRHQAHISAQMQVQVAQQEQNSLDMPQFKKSFVNMLLIYCVFLFCFLPYLVVMFVISTTGRTIFRQSVYEVVFSFVFINSTLNPILYCWRFKQIRAAVVKTTKTIFTKGPVQCSLLRSRY